MAGSFKVSRQSRTPRALSLDMATVDAGRLLANAKKRRGVARASLTRLGNRIKDLEGGDTEPKTLELAQRMSQELSDLDTEFWTHHHALVDLIDDEETLATEQETLDAHDDLVAELAVRVKQVIAASSPSSNESSRRIASRKLTHLQKSLTSIMSIVSDTSTTVSDTCLLRQYEERTNDINRDLVKTRDDLHRMELADEDKLFELQDSLESQASGASEASTPPSNSKGVKLPKLDVPTFDGNILNWRSFWEQYSISVHDRAHLSDSEKLVYLQQSLKGGSAKVAIEGLSRSGEYYAEAIECLQSRYDRPRLIHQAHVRMILETPSLKEGNGKELRRLHDSVQQHLRALKSMGCEAPGPFITSVLELKLDSSTRVSNRRSDNTYNRTVLWSVYMKFVHLLQL